MTNYDDSTQKAVERIDSLLGENIHQAKREDADEEAIASILLEHRDRLKCKSRPTANEC